MKHGGDLTEAKARHGAGDPPWLDLSTGINPHPWPVRDGLRRVGWERLPGAAETDALLAAARVAYRIPAKAAVVAAPGTQALIQWLPRLAPSGAVAILGPTYGEHEASWRAAGREVAPSGTLLPHPEVLREAEPRRTQDADASFEAGLRPAPQDENVSGAGAPRLLHRIVVNPNNPDGHFVGLAALREAAEACAAAGGWLLVDEAFADLDPGMSAVGLVPDLPVVVLRSFGKFYGLAGLRLGFAITPPAIADALREALGDWAVSGPALAVGAAALADEDWAEAMRARLAREAEGLSRVLIEAGLEPAGGTSLYRLVRHPDATGLHARLAAAHIWCRRFEWAPDLLRFGLPPDATGLERLRVALAAHVQGTRIASPATSAR